MAGALGAAPGAAQAAPQPDDFTGAEFVETALVDGGVELATFNHGFDGAAGLPASLLPGTAWGTISACAAAGEVTLAGGSLVVDAARADSGAGGPGSVLEFRATFGDEPNQHAGFGTDLHRPPWAIFSTHDQGGKVYARVSNGDEHSQRVPVADPGKAHLFRIAWLPSGVFEFYVDDKLVAAPDLAITHPLTAQVSDCNRSSEHLTVDSMLLRSRTAGTYTSKEFDAGDSPVTAIAFRPDSPSATGIAYETRTRSAGGSWTGWGRPAATAPARYFQYRATLTTADFRQSPRLNGATVYFASDTTVFDVTIGSIAVSGDSATVPFSSGDGAASYECSVDGGAYAGCTSPARLTGLPPGTHTVSVRGLDSFGNVSTASKQFVVEATPGTGGTTTPGTGTTTTGTGGTTTPGAGTTTPGAGDARKPAMGMPRAADVTKLGKVRLPLTCPDHESYCDVSLRLKWNGATVASKSARIGGGDGSRLSLKLSRAARTKLAKAGKLKVAAQLTVTDAAGNRHEASRTLRLRAL